MTTDISSNSTPPRVQSSASPAYTPTKSSPLSSLPLNNMEWTSPHSFTAACLNNNNSNNYNSNNSSNNNNATYSRNSTTQTDPKRRPFRPNPLLQTPEDARERRRNLFLKKLRDHREEKVLESRGGMDEMMRVVFLSEQKRWENMHRRAALKLELQDNVEDEERELMASENEHLDESARVDEIIQNEERELEHLISCLDIDDSTNDKVDNNNDAYEIDFCSDELRCIKCDSDELIDMEGEIICFECGWGFVR